MREKSKNAIAIACLAGALVLVGAGCASAPPGTGAAAAAQPSSANGGTSDASVKVFTMTAKRWEFDPNVIRVKQGDRVRLLVTSQDVTHGFSLPDFNVNETLPPGQTVTIEFTADRQGTFEFRCSVFCGEGHRGQRGTLIVE